MLETKFLRVTLMQVLRYYAKDFQVPDGGKVLRWDAVVDTTKDTVVFELVVEKDEKKEKI